MNVLTIDVEPDFPPHFETTNGIEGLKKITNLLKKNYCNATFFVVAELLEEHPEISEILRGFEIGCHGLKHVDYTALDEKTITEHFVKAINIFEKHAIKPTGFRAPYAKVDEKVLGIASKFFMYDSSKSVWLRKKYEVHEFPILMGGKAFGVHPAIFKILYTLPIENKIFFIHPWEYGGMDFSKINSKRKKLKILGYAEKNYQKNLQQLLKKRTHSISELIAK